MTKFREMIAHGQGTNAPSATITLEVSPEMIATLQQMSRDAGLPLDIVFTRAIGLYRGALCAASEGKHVDYPTSPDALEAEFTGLVGPGGLDSAKLSADPGPARWVDPWRASGVDETLPLQVATYPVDQVYRHLEKYHGIAVHVASDRLHRIKEQDRLSADIELLFARTGNVYRYDDRTCIGSLTSSGKTGGEG